MQPMNVLARSMGSAAAATRTEAKSQALSWLAQQLRWERTLDHLRHDEDDQAAKAA
jgi:hypothetical protein